MTSIYGYLTPRRGMALAGLGSVALVVSALVLTRLLQLEPCPLCIFQRVLYLAIAVFALAGALWPRALAATGALALLAGAGGLATALYQSWMQAFPARFTSCSIGVPSNPIEHLVDRLGEWWPAMFYAWGDCTSREWSLFGLSMANWSAVMFLGIIVVLVLAMRARRA
ncbi:MAG: disulfide bond formation protein B [Thiohalomonadaceae bacterium]